MKVKVLDCTLRDGGYYNNWDFDRTLVKSYVSAMAKIGVDFVELGLRNFHQKKYLGASAYTTKEYILSLDLPKGPKYGVMIDAKTILSQASSIKDSIDALFDSAKNEPIDLVRVAAHFTEVPDCFDILNYLKEKGYIVGLNVMQASLRSSDELEDLSKKISRNTTIDVLYFADSLGSMGSQDVKRVANSIAKYCKGDLGFHAHNNMGQALSNVKVAHKNKCTWIDATVMGMGRGAGNAELEYLINLSFIEASKESLDIISRLIINYFEPLKEKYNWGASIAYYQSAILGVHPTYIQNILFDKSLRRESIPEIIADLGKLDKPNSYNKSNLESVLSKNTANISVNGKKVDKIFNKREVVIVAQTSQAADLSQEIQDYVKSKDAVLISINLPSSNKIKYDYVAISHNQKFREEEENYSRADHKFIAPKELFKSTNINIAHDYGIKYTKDRFSPKNSYVEVPNSLTISYLAGFCIQAGAEVISLVGFSGFSSDDIRHNEMQAFISTIEASGFRIRSLTKTKYLITESSIYAI